MPLKGGLQTGGNPARDGRFSPCSAQSRFCNPRRRPALDLSRFCSHDGECTGSVMVRATGRAEQESPRSGALLLSRSAASGENPPTGIIAAPLFASGTTWRGASKGRTALTARLPHEAQTSENQGATAWLPPSARAPQGPGRGAMDRFAARRLAASAPVFRAGRRKFVKRPTRHNRAEPILRCLEQDFFARHFAPGVRDDEFQNPQDFPRLARGIFPWYPFRNTATAPPSMAFFSRGFPNNRRPPIFGRFRSASRDGRKNLALTTKCTESGRGIFTSAPAGVGKSFGARRRRPRKFRRRLPGRRLYRARRAPGSPS